MKELSSGRGACRRCGSRIAGKDLVHACGFLRRHDALRPARGAPTATGLACAVSVAATVALDRTGTLTEGIPRVTDVRP
ncbi:hypothetical protein, partial [Streptomyces kebangsaanensis]|uniref:hypothetical protein n=1 Tax=Streptomyces kebangsaanensis TaxID=864058 RepID=UPI001F3C9114